MPCYRVQLNAALPISPYECEAANETEAIRRFRTEHCRIQSTTEKWTVERLDVPPPTGDHIEPAPVPPAVPPAGDTAVDLADLGIGGGDLVDLRRAGVTTLADLRTFIEQHGSLLAVKGIGPAGEQKILAAIAAHHGNRPGKPGHGPDQLVD